MNQTMQKAFDDELAKLGGDKLSVSLSWIGKRLSSTAREGAAPLKTRLFELLGGKAQSREELRSLVKERMRRIGHRVSGPAPVGEIDHKLHGRLRRDPVADREYSGHMDKLVGLLQGKQGSVRDQAFADELGKLAAAAKAKAKEKSPLVDKVVKGVAGAGLAAGAIGAGGLAVGHVIRSEERHGELLKALEGIAKKNPATDAAGAAKTIASLGPVKKLLQRLKLGEAAKVAVSPGKAVEAIFHRVYRGKQVLPTINRMAKGYLETAARMGSPVTREGAKSWIKEVQKTKAL